MQIQWQLLHFDALSNAQLYEVISLREKVFVVEQNCAYQETDGLDIFSYHLLGYNQNELIAYLRIIPPGKQYTEASIGRVIVKKEYRELNLGKLLMKKGHESVEQLFGRVSIKIGAQARLRKFYESLQYQTISEPYDEDGIMHIKMLLKG